MSPIKSPLPLPILRPDKVNALNAATAEDMTSSATNFPMLALEPAKGKKNNLGNHLYSLIMSSDASEFARLLSLRENTNCRVSNKKNANSLHVACRRGSLYFLKRLLDAGADPLMRVGQKKPPLHLLLTENRHAKQEYVSLVKELLSHGASPLASKHSEKKQASVLMIHWVREPVFAEIYEILLEAEKAWSAKVKDS